ISTSALELAIQSSARKWTFDDFTDCFPQYVEENKEGARQTYEQVADYIENANKRDLEKLFQDYELQRNIETLDKIVSEAKSRKATGNIGPNVWSENLHPRSAAGGRTIPILEAQAKRLRQTLQMLETETQALASELQDTVNETHSFDSRSVQLLDKIDEAHGAWSKVPMEEVEAWTAQVAETSKPTLRS
ncbi:hypothetical protein C8J57DRAFT_1298062, partial [Mycena rebaudengoi]